MNKVLTLVDDRTTNTFKVRAIKLLTEEKKKATVCLAALRRFKILMVKNNISLCAISK